MSVFTNDQMARIRKNFSEVSQASPGCLFFVKKRTTIFAEQKKSKSYFVLTPGEPVIFLSLSPTNPYEGLFLTPYTMGWVTLSSLLTTS